MNMNMMCTRCKKRMAVVYLSYGDKTGQSQGNQALCLKCAKELNIQPFKEMLDKMGVSDEDPDVEIIIDSLLEIQRKLCMEMFDLADII